MSMDKELKEKIIELSEAQRMIEEEGFHGDNIAGAIEVNEGIEDNISLLKKLQSRLRGWTAAFTVGLITLIIILLYMLFASNSLSFFMGSNGSPQEIEITTLVPDEPVSSQPDEPTPPETIPETTEEPSETPETEINQEISEIEFNLVEEFYSIDTFLNFVYEGTEFYADTTVRDFEVGATKFEETTINGRKADLEQRITKPGSWYVTVPYEADEATVKQSVEEVFDTYYKASDLWLEDSNISLNMLKNVQAKLDNFLGASPMRKSDDGVYTIIDTGEVPEHITKIKINFADLFHTANYPADPYAE